MRSARRKAPAAARNREPIAVVLEKELPEAGLVLEVASGTGEHALYFAQRFPRLTWQPSDPDPGALESIEAWRLTEGPPNLLAPIRLDASSGDWPIERADALMCINMIHISPVGATDGLARQAGQLLAPGAPLIVYGPYLEDNVETAPSNVDFDADLRARNPAWGLRRREWLDDLAARHGLARTRRVAMPANNLMLVYRKAT